MQRGVKTAAAGVRTVAAAKSTLRALRRGNPEGIYGGARETARNGNGTNDNGNLYGRQKGNPAGRTFHEPKRQHQRRSINLRGTQAMVKQRAQAGRRW